MKITLLIICLNALFVFGQQTGTFYYSALGEACNKRLAKTKYVIKSSERNSFKEIVSTKYDSYWTDHNSYSIYRFETDSSITIQMYINNELAETTKRIYKKQNDSIYSFIDYVKDSVVTEKGFALNLLPLLYHGEVESFYRNGNKRAEAIYKNNRLISNLRWTETGEKDISNVFSFEQVEIEPKFLNGSITGFLEKEVTYPEEAFKKQIEGRVIVQIIIMEDGSIEDVRVVKSVDPQLDAESIRVLKKSNKMWIPGKINNTPVRVAMFIPIRFSL